MHSFKALKKRTYSRVMYVLKFSVNDEDFYKNLSKISEEQSNESQVDVFVF